MHNSCALQLTLVNHSASLLRQPWSFAEAVGTRDEVHMAVLGQLNRASTHGIFTQRSEHIQLFKHICGQRQFSTFGNQCRNQREILVLQKRQRYQRCCLYVTWSCDSLWNAAWLRELLLLKWGTFMSGRKGDLLGYRAPVSLPAVPQGHNGKGHFGLMS